MPQHVIVDGSNLATEGRTAPSLKQLNEAVDAYRLDHPEALITVVVDATFGHRIDPKEVPAFERAIETNAYVAPPAGAIGRGDGFILSIAQKVKATVLSNDSYQEFHGEYAWLFDEGRLVGGKPVPHIGWVFVYRTPVRGPVSRRSVKEQKIVEKSPGRRRGNKPSVDLAALPTLSANAPMPVPKSAPPGAVMPQEKASAPKSANDLMAFLSFVEHHPVGTTVEAVVDSYSSHGAYVLIGDAHGYLPLRLMGDPPPRSARDAVAVGEVVTLVVHSFAPARRSIDLAVLAMSPDAKPPAPAKPRRGDAKKAAAALAAAAKAAAAKPVEATTDSAKPVTKPVAKSGKKPAKAAVQPVKQAVKAAAKKSADKKSIEKKATEKKSTELKSAVVKSAELKPAVVKPAEKQSVDVKPAEKKRTERKPIERKRVENNTVDKKLASTTAAPAPAPRSGARKTGRS